MKKISMFAWAGMIALATTTSCKRDISETIQPETNSVAGKPAPPAACNPNAYTIILESRTLIGSNWEWVWSVKNPNPGNGNNGTSQDLSHWGMQFGPCFNWAHVVGAAYSSNGNTWTSFTPSYQNDPSQSCLTTPVLKFGLGTSRSAKSYYKLILSADYPTVTNASGYYKSGSRMPCCVVSFSGVGCQQQGT